MILAGDLSKELFSKCNRPVIAHTEGIAHVEPTLCVPNCPICHGTGFTRKDVPISDPAFGKLTPCPNKPLNIADPKKYGLVEDEIDLDFSSVGDANNSLEAVDLLRKTLERGKGWVYLWGTPGLAKSLLLKIAVATYLRNKQLAAYVRMPTLLQNIRDGFNPEYGGGESTRRYERWCSMPLLAVDEIDKTNDTDWAREKRFELFDIRYEAALTGNSITIIASQISPESMEPYFKSRIRDGRFTAFELVGTDMRPRMRW